ncbi:MAG: serine hydrolase domain-containing protein [Clostridiaceae bacterium]
MSTRNDIRELLQSFLSFGPAGCGLSICENGKEIFRECVGYADLEAKRQMKPDDIIRLFSNTKVFTNALALTLYDKGKFLLTDPVSDYLPEFSHSVVGFFTNNGTFSTRAVQRPIRIMDLMTMSSGLTYGTQMAGGENSQTNIRIQQEIDALEFDGSYSTRAFSKAMASVPLLFDPGTQWHYGYSHYVLGELIEVCADMSFGDYLEKAICGPLGLADTSFFLPEEKKMRLARQYRAPGQDGNREINEELDRMYDPNHRFESGGAGLLSTLNDFSRFAAMLSMGGSIDGVRLLSRNTIDLMRANHLGTSQLATFYAAQENGWEFARGYGYGLGVRTMVDKVRAGSNGSVGEFGWSGAAGTWLMADPANALSAVYIQQVLPNLFESYCHPRLRNTVYAFDEISANREKR